MSSYFQAIRRLKDSNFYINAIASQFALWKATQDQVDNPIYKAYSRATTNRLICRELAETPVQRDAEFYQPGIPAEPGPVGPGGGTVTVMINFDHELEDRSTFNNDAIHEFTNQQLLFIEGKDTGLSFAINFNPASNSTYDKLWIPFSPSTQIIYDTPNGFSIFTRIMPLVTTDLGTVSSGPPPQTNRIVYYGGPVFNKYKVAIYNIFWGSGWNDSSSETWANYLPTSPYYGNAQNVNGPSIRSSIITNMQNIANSEYWDGLWSYGGQPGITIGGNFTNTTTPYPMALGETLPAATSAGMGAEGVILDERAAGHVPNWDAFGEPATDKDGTPLAAPNNYNLDYRHLIFVHLDPRHMSQEGSAGFSWKSYTPSPVGTVYYAYCALGFTAPEQTTEFSVVDHHTQAWCHELFHQIGEGPGFCVCQQGCTGFNYHVGDECTWISHSSANCQSNFRRISGAMVPGYWSDIDGQCIWPGTGSAWTRAPTNTGTIIRRYIFQKLDDLDNGATAAIGSSGTVFFNVKKAGTEYKIKSAAGAVLVNQWADIWFTFDSTTNQARMYINNVLHNTASTEVLAWNNTHSHTILGNYNMGATIGQFRGRMDDFRLYRSAVVTTQDVENLNNNGLTVTGIENTQEQGVFIVNRVKIDKKLDNTSVYVPGDVATGDVPAATASFTTTSFSSTSFTL